MIITITGRSYTGKTTAAKLLAKELDYGFYSMGLIRRKIAEEQGITIQELNKIAEENPESDVYVDVFLKGLAKIDNFVAEARLGFYHIPNSLKVYFDADIEERINRAMRDLRTTEKYHRREEAKDAIINLEKSDIKRYLKLYGVNPHDLTDNKYDLIIDSTNKKPEELVKIIKEKMI
jgi:cytidylate kinase